MEIENKEEDKEIDFLALAKKVWHRRKMVIIWCVVGGILGLIIGFSIPKEYTTEVKLAPEKSDGKGMGSSLGALAMMAGVNMGNNGNDAVYPDLYPEIMKSVPFCLSLLDIPLTDREGERKFTVAEYLENDTKAPWWSVITGLPSMIIGVLSSDSNADESTVNDQPNPFRLTKKEKGLVDALNGAIQAKVDNQTSVATITVTMQDPMVSAILADSVVRRLQEYVTDYRTNKARKDLQYIEKLNREAKDAYYAAQQKYANYLDTHQGIVMHSAQTMRDRLENETTLAFNLFNQTSQQLQMAKAKVQEETPVFATIKPATVPLRPSAPRRMLLLAGFIVLAFMACVGWILFVEPLRKSTKDEKDDVNDKASLNIRDEEVSDK